MNGKKIAAWGGGLLAFVLFDVVAFGIFAKHNVDTRFHTPYDLHVDPIDVPFPLSDSEIAELRAEKLAEWQTAHPGPDPAAPVDPAAVADQPPADLLAGVDLAQIANERAIARGLHIVDSRGGCKECHGADLGGHAVIDDAMVAHWNAPNITPGGVTKAFSTEDWVRQVRHGVGPDKFASMMPSLDFTWFSDQELSDVIAYCKSVPPVDHVMPPASLGPVFYMVLFTGQGDISAEAIDHTAPRLKYPPTITADAEYGKHLAQVCTGCHGQGFSGGPIPGGDPSWPPAQNLTPDETGLKGWTFADFTTAVRDGKRPDGSALDNAMPVRMTSKFNDVEVGALWAYLQTVPAKANGHR